MVCKSYFKVGVLNEHKPIDLSAGVGGPVHQMSALARVMATGLFPCKVETL